VNVLAAYNVSSTPQSHVAVARDSMKGWISSRYHSQSTLVQEQVQRIIMIRPLATWIKADLIAHSEKVTC
jgi:hypothetical protein